VRLLEARRRLLASDASAAEVGYSVGYSSVPQFTREYRRLFGAPPGRDAEELRGRVAGAGSAVRGRPT